MRIGELSRRTGASVRLLRYYEEKGLIGSTRSASGQRHFTEDAVPRVEFVRRLLAAGATSRAIAEMMPCFDTPLEENFDSAMERLAQERLRITSGIEDLLRARKALDALMDTAREHRARLPRNQAGRPLDLPVHRT
ncbi:MAG TPA: MerR family transcriptional regulator [Nocardiopsis listeri]|uniref:MerR family transcriptional regulator n=1 Tax=Nocardiopsis listeri TaxID=53440 RepID=UPI001DCD4689|nr:MerR family transcriptional regulator [Nocardiopsis listeri]HJE59068.1 MerR family transcriptional regulator [Nocardiopsis listeri]